MFLNPVMLAGIGGAAIPLVLHLLARARYRTIDWGAMMFLAGASPRQQQRSRLRQWLLLAIRMAIVALLAMALARPVVQGRWAALADEARTTAVIILDRSASMAFDEGGRTRFDRAREAALQVLARLRAGDQVALLLSGDEGGVTDPRPTGDLQAVASVLTDLKPSFGQADFAAALVQAETTFARVPRDHHALFVITDRQSLNWQAMDESFFAARGNAPAGEAGSSRHLLTVGGTAAANVSVDSVDLVNPPAVRQLAAEVEVIVTNHGQSAQANLPLTLSVGNRERFATTVSLAAGESRPVRAWLDFDRVGPLVLRAQLTAADLGEDNSALAVVEVSEPLQVLVISGDERQGSFRKESDFLALALAPFETVGRKGPACAAVEVVPVDQLAAAQLPRYDAVVLANVPQVSPDAARALEQYVYDGGGVIIAPGGLSRIDAYNQVLYREGTGLLPAAMSPPTSPDGTSATGLLGLELGHPVFRFLRGLPDPVPTAIIGRYFPVTPGAQARVLATYATGEAFLVELPLGLGRVLQMTTPLDADWGTLPLTGFYLPYTQSLVRYAAGGALPRRHVAPGQELHQVVRAPVERARSIVITPDSRFIRPQVTGGTERSEIRFADTTVPGVYQLRLRSGEQTLSSSFVVQRPTAESDLAPIAALRLAEIADRLDLHWTDLSAQPLSRVLDAQLAQRELWGTLVALVLGLMALELFLTRWTVHQPSAEAGRLRWAARLRSMPDRFMSPPRHAEPRAGNGATLALAPLAAVHWQEMSLLPWLIVAGAALAALAVWMYGAQVRQAGTRWGYVLPALRILAVAALVVSVLKPALIRPRESDDAGAIAILVDRSQSMGIRDTGRGPAHLVSLADGLGMLPGGVREAAGAALQGQLAQLEAQVDAILRAQAEAEYARLASGLEGAADRRVVELREAFGRAAAALVEQAGQLPGSGALLPAIQGLQATVNFHDVEQVRQVRQRITAATRAAREHQAGIDQKLYHADPRVKQVADELAALTRLELAEQMLTDPAYGLLPRLSPGVVVFGYTIGESVQPLPLQHAGEPVPALDLVADAAQSEVTGGVNRVLELLRGGDVRAVVLLSDGRQVGVERQVVSSLAGADVPIFAVVAAPAGLMRDVVISRLELPVSAYVGETVIIRADVRSRRVWNTDATVRLRAAGREQTKQIRLRDDTPVTVEFELTLRQPGTPEVELQVEPLSGEATVANNTVRRRLKVSGDALRVGAFSGWGGWDFQFMRSALERTPGIELRDAIMHAGPLPLRPEEILELDVLVLSDVRAGDLTAGQRDAVHRLVHERGAGVIMMAGDGEALRSWQQDVLLSALLPWQAGEQPLWRIWPGASAGFHPVVSPQGRQIDALRLEEGGSAAAASWPGVYRLLALPQLRANVWPLLVERDTSLPVLTEARVGAGRVLSLLINESWRWRYRSGERQHERFWRQLVHYAGEEPYQSRTNRLAFDADRLTIEPGEPLRVRARRVLEPQSTRELRVRVMQGQEVIDEMAMPPIGGGRYERVIPSLPAGNYTLELWDESRPDDNTLWLPLEVQRTLEPELQDLSPDEAQMRRLADTSGGRVLALDEARQLPGLIDEVLSRRPQTVQQTLWDSPYLFAFVLACLSLEWALRKQAGLA